MKKTSVLLGLLSASLWLGTTAKAETVNINGTGISVEANAAPVHAPVNPEAVALLP
ncbi:MAG TPA: ABC transporter substrate-binding protein, partial [Erwinia persicina]|nr:ABC transporter substrate-binding protein [Erwinia persicina]